MTGPNIAAHYDLGNELFSRFLDDSMTYSSGWFRSADDTLLDAVDREARPAVPRARSSDRATTSSRSGPVGARSPLHAASRYGCRVTTTTLSAEQHDLATERVARAGLGDRVEVRNDDYRDLRGTYDKLASIEMIEAVDWRDLDTFFRTCTERLAPDGLMGLQAIVQRRIEVAGGQELAGLRQDPRLPRRLPPVDRVDQPLARPRHGPVDALAGGLRPPLRRDASSVAGRRSASGSASSGRSATTGASPRLWEFYLCYCEAGFEEREVSVVQSILARPGHRPATPWQRAGVAAPGTMPADRRLAVTRR